MSDQKKPFREQIRQRIKTQYEGNMAKAARDIGVEHTTLWRYLNEPKRVIALRTFAYLCSWANVDPKTVIDEYTK